jgi:hypothetical protein
MKNINFISLVGPEVPNNRDGMVANSFSKQMCLIKYQLLVKNLYKRFLRKNRVFLANSILSIGNKMQTTPDLGSTLLNIELPQNIFNYPKSNFQYNLSFLC